MMMLENGRCGCGVFHFYIVGIVDNLCIVPFMKAVTCSSCGPLCTSVNRIMPLRDLPSCKSGFP